MENDNILNSSNTTIPSSNLKPISKNLSHIVEMLAQKKSQETNQSIKKLPGIITDIFPRGFKSY